MITLARPILTTASLLALAMGTGAARAAESCSAYPTGTAESIESSDLASKLGAVPKPGKELRFAYGHQNAHQ
jgi:ribose transport system substrate-binding protein